MTLSGPAQAILDGAAPPAEPAAQDVWSTKAVANALAALNDTEGGTAVADLLAAHKLISDLISDPKNFDSSAGRADGARVTAAFLGSAYAQHLQEVVDQITAFGRYEAGGYWAPSTLQARLDAFQALSADDQKTYVGALNQQQALIHPKAGGPAFASVESYVANQTALIGVARATKAVLDDPANAPPPQNEVGPLKDAFHWKIDYITAKATAAGDQGTVDLLNLVTTPSVGDSWTARAQAHFASYGDPPTASSPEGELSPSWRGEGPGHTPPSADELARALTDIADESGNTSLSQRLVAYDLLQDYAANSGGYGPARLAIVKNAHASPFAAFVITALAQADSQLPSRGGTASEISRSAPSRLNSPSGDHRQIAFDQHDRPPEGKFRSFAPLDSYKADIAVRQAAGAILDSVLETYRTDRLSDAGGRTLATSSKSQKLLELFQTPDQKSAAPWSKER